MNIKEAKYLRRLQIINDLKQGRQQRANCFKNKKRYSRKEKYRAQQVEF